MVGGQVVIDHEDDNLSDKEVYGNTKNIPAIGEFSSHWWSTRTRVLL